MAKVSDTKTRMIQYLFSMVIAGILAYFTVAAEWFPFFGDSLFFGIEMVAWVVFWLFWGLSIAGILLYGMNLIFYKIQVYRLGKPSEWVEEQ